MNRKRWQRLVMAIAVLLWTIVLPWPGAAQISDPPAAPQAGTVFLGDDILFVLRDPLTYPSVEVRAQSVTQRVREFASNPAIPIESAQVGEQREQIVLFYGSTIITPITKTDASAIGMAPQPAAERYLAQIKRLTTEYRETGNLGSPAQIQSLSGRLSQLWEFFTNLSVREEGVSYPLAIAYTLLATLILGLLLWGLNRLFPLVHKGIRFAQRRRWLEVRLYKVRLLSAVQVGRGLFVVTQLVRFLLNGVVILGYAIVVLNLYPLTRKLGRQIFRYVQSVLIQVVGAIIGYLPSLLIVLFILFLTYYSLRVIKPIFTQIEKEHITFKGFYPEWAAPTYRLTEMFTWAIAGVMCFPYLPGFGSDAFQGLSIFLGVLVSLGSTTAVANAVAGVILIYTRAFRLGDYIAVGDTKGAVEEKSLLVTRLRTPNNVIVTIPNAALIANNIHNYSISGRDTGQPVVLTTTITLGYDVPWQDVYTTLVAAAHRTPDVLDTPSPEVYQTGLGDFSVSYELRVYSDRPTLEPEIHSALHQNIQDACNSADIEILSPTYSAIRDGNTSTIPENYLPADYKPDGFKLNPLGNLFQVDLNWGNGKAKTPKPQSVKANGKRN